MRQSLRASASSAASPANGLFGDGPRRKKDRKGSDTAPRAAANGAARRPPANPEKGKRGKPGKPRPDTGRPPRTERRGPSPNSPFAGLAALLADARKD